MDSVAKINAVRTQPKAQNKQVSQSKAQSFQGSKENKEEGMSSTAKGALVTAAVALAALGGYYLSKGKNQDLLNAAKKSASEFEDKFKDAQKKADDAINDRI